MKILIAGVGIRGERLVRSLQIYDLKVDAFIDNNPEKWNKEIVDGIICFPVDHFIKEDAKYIVIVSPEEANELLCSLKKKYTNVLNLEVTEMILQSAYNVGYKKFFPVGHFYSLYPDAREILKKPDYTEMDAECEIKGVNLCKNIQEMYLNKMINLYPMIPLWKNVGENDPKWRYRIGNPSLSYGDAVGLFCMLNIIKPKRIIEVGSGYSSAMILDINEYCFAWGCELAFIEPYPELLNSLLKKYDRIHLVKEKLQTIDLDFFSRLEDGDILFVDSTHVSKTGSDVNYLFFEIIPRLNPGVIIHLHDIFYPFEYPHKWLKQGMVWNELFLLRSFLQYNDNYEILYFQNMIEKLYKTKLESVWPQKKQTIHGGSFWMRKLR